MTTLTYQFTRVTTLTYQFTFSNVESGCARNELVSESGHDPLERTKGVNGIPITRIGELVSKSGRHSLELVRSELVSKSGHSSLKRIKMLTELLITASSFRAF